MARFDPEKMAAYRLARRHTRAVAAMIGEADSFVDFGLVPARAVVELHDLQNQITALLIASIRDLEKQTTP